METVLYILFAYILGVAIYTMVVKNDAMHKFSPHTNVKSIILDGMKRMAISFVIIAAIFGIIYLISSIVHSY